jgi:hypothetical protein
MLNQKQFGCLKFFIGKLKSKIFSVCKAKISRQINDIRDSAPNTENTDQQGLDMGFYTDCLSTNQFREF